MMVANKGHHATDPLVRLRLFGPVEALSFSGESVLPRGRKAQAILCYLALTQERFIPRQRLISLLWSSRWIEQGRASLRQSLLELRSALGSGYADLLTIERDRIALDREKVWIDGLTRRPDQEEERPSLDFQPNRLLETLTGIDPKFDEWIAQVRGTMGVASGRGKDADSARDHQAYAGRQNPADGSRTAAGGVLLSVLPILQIGSGPIDDYVAPALTQEIVTALARVRWLRVRFSTDRGGADYLLEGYISQVGDGFRLVLRLLDHTDREVILWTGTTQLDRPLQPSSLSSAVEQIVEQLDPEILAIETRKVLRRPLASDDSYECMLRAVPLLYRFEIGAWRQATELLARACRSDPQHGRAFAFSALCRVTGLAQGWSEEPAAELRKADHDAVHAVSCDPRDSLALSLNAHIQSFIHHDFDAAQALFERAVRANPSCGLTWGYSSLTYAYLGHTDEAARRLARAQTIMIHDPYLSFMESFAAVIAFFARDWVEAIRVCRRQLEIRPNFVAMRKLLIGALCLTGRFDEAEREDRRLREQEPGFDWPKHLRGYPFGRQEDRLAVETALRRAGLLSGGSAASRRPFSATSTAAPLPRLSA
jgi:adenylate cyclase